MSTAMTFVGIAVGLALWGTGVRLLYLLATLIDVLSPAKPDEKPLGVWLAFLALTVLLAPLVAVVGLLAVMFRMLGMLTRLVEWASPSTRQGG